MIKLIAAIKAVLFASDGRQRTRPQGERHGTEGRRLASVFLDHALRLTRMFESQPDPAARSTNALYERPVLVMDPGVHIAIIKRADADAEGRWLVTVSDDKTVRVWSLADGMLQRTIRLPAGPGNIGKCYAVAISPDGTKIVAGGWTRGVANAEQIYLFDRVSGALVRRIQGLPNVVHHLVFSPDGKHLAATLGSGGGLRVYARASGWAEIARDAAYGDKSGGASFARDGRLATTAYDGRVRLYAGPLRGDLHPARDIAALAACRSELSAV